MIENYLRGRVGVTRIARYAPEDTPRGGVFDTETKKDKNPKVLVFIICAQCA